MRTSRGLKCENRTYKLKRSIVMNSIDTRFSRNVLEAVQKTRCTCFIGSKTTRLRRVDFLGLATLINAAMMALTLCSTSQFE